MQAYIIGIEGRYRGELLESALVADGLPFTRVPGVVLPGSSAADAAIVDQHAASVLLRRELTSGEVGCALAHRDACRTFLASDDKAALIFEDDARPAPPNTRGAHLPWEQLCEFVSQQDAPAVLSLYSDTRWFVAGEMALRSGDTEVWTAQNIPINATGYMLNRAAAELLIDDDRPVKYVADWPPHLARQIKFFVTYPWLAPAADDVASSLQGERAGRRTVDDGAKLQKFWRHAKAALHITWARERKTYGSYGVYLEHEFRRILVLKAARRLSRNSRGLLHVPLSSRSRR